MGYDAFSALALQNAHQVVDKELDMLENGIAWRHRQWTQVGRGEDAAAHEDALFHLQKQLEVLNTA